MKTLIILAVFFMACNEMHAIEETDTDTGEYWDCGHLCDVETGCDQNDNSDEAWSYCVDMCEETILEVEQDFVPFMNCVFDCGWKQPVCHDFTVCVATCYGETG